MSERNKKFDPNASPDDCVKDLRKLQERHPLKSISRNFYRINGRYSDGTWDQFFGTFHEFRRQAGLELSRDQHSLEKKIAKHASLDVYRDFYDTEVLPYQAKYANQQDKSGRWKTLLIGSDFHDLEVDPFMLSVFIDTAKRVQPDIICLAGDIFDCPEFSKYDIDPREWKIVERFSFVKRHIFAALRRACPNSQIDMIIANHEIRILKLLANKTPAMRVLLSDVMGLGLNDVFGLDDFEINMIAKVDLSAYNDNDFTKEQNDNFKLYYDCFVASHYKDLGYGVSGVSGHTHRADQITFVNIPMGKCTWTNLGCMAKTNPEYVEHRDKWTQSFMMAHIDTQKKIVAPEHIIVPGEHVVVHGQRYVRNDK